MMNDPAPLPRPDDRALIQNQLWARQMNTVAYRVYSLIFFRPASPSFCSFSSGGYTVPSSSKMIHYEMYGMIPNPKMVLMPMLDAENSDSIVITRSTPPPSP